MSGVKLNSQVLSNQLTESSNRESFQVDPKIKEEVITYYAYSMKCAEMSIQPLSVEEWKQKGKPLSPDAVSCAPDGFEFGESEYSIPADTDSLLSALEQGKPPTVEGE